MGFESHICVSTYHLGILEQLLFLMLKSCPISNYKFKRFDTPIFQRSLNYSEVVS